MKALLLSIALLAAGLPGAVRAAGAPGLSLPVPAAGHADVSRGAVCLGAVEDQREFREGAKDRSIPSIREGLARATAAERGAVIGRRRGAFGRAKGNVLLAAGDSVPLRVRALIEEGLRRRGYVVGAAPESPVVITAGVDRFWAWPEADYYGAKLTAQVGCVLTIRRGDEVTKVRVGGEARVVGKSASEANWRQAYTQAFREFLAELEATLARNGL